MIERVQGLWQNALIFCLVISFNFATAWVPPSRSTTGTPSTRIVATTTFQPSDRATSTPVSSRGHRGVPLASSFSAERSSSSSVTATSTGSVPTSTAAYPERTAETTACLERLFDTSSNKNNAASPIYLFDGVCNFCNDSVHWLHDMDDSIRFVSLQSATGQAVLQHFGRSKTDVSSLVLVTDAQTAHFTSGAVLELCQHVQGLSSVAGLATWVSRTVPAPLRDAVYEVASSSRHVFGQSAGPTCRVDLDPDRFLD